MTVFHRLAKCVLLILVLMCMSGVMLAHSIDYTFTGTGSGTLGSTSFTNDSFTVSIRANSSHFGYQSDLGAYGIENLSGTITLSGIGTISFAAPLFVFGGNGSDAVGFGNFFQGNLIADINTGQGLQNYSLASSFGPIKIDDDNLPQFCGVATSRGTLCFARMSDDLTVKATVPEPSSMLQLGTGLIGVLAAMRKRLLG